MPRRSEYIGDNGTVHTCCVVTQAVMCHDATFGDVSHFSQCYAADDSGFFAVLLLENVQLFQNRFQKQEEKK